VCVRACGHACALAQLLAEGIVVAVPQYVPQERKTPEPSVRVTVTANHEDKDIDRTVAAIKAAFRSVGSRGRHERASVRALTGTDRSIIG
jgi:hypothetical protein